MGYELTADSVTSGVVSRLGELFPDVARYRETVPAQRMVFPHFFVHQLTVDTQTERRNHWIVNYLVNIRYHVVADPASATDSLQQQLDDMGIRLLSELHEIYWDDMPVRIRNPRVEKVDGTLHWFGNISVMAARQEDTGPLQEKLDINTITAG